MDKVSLQAPCPFCCSAVEWCGGRPGDDEHDCHMIVCPNCKVSVDFSNTNPTDEAADVDELRSKCAAAWNKRVTWIPDSANAVVCSKHGPYGHFDSICPKCSAETANKDK